MNLSEQPHNLIPITIMRRKPIWLFPMIAMLLCVGCTDDFEPIIPTTGDRIEFSATIGEEWEAQARTRSNTGIFELPGDTVYTMISETGDGDLYLHTRSDFNRHNPFIENKSSMSRGSMMTSNEYGSFGLFAGIYENDWNEEDYGANYIYNVECKKTTDNNYAPTNSYYWPGMNQKIRFWGYAPYNHSSLKLSSLDLKGTPTITYTVPDENENQIDLIAVMADGSKTGDGTQNLTFNHILTAIQFVTTDDVREGSIKSISINGAYSKATAQIGSSDWYGYSDSKNFSLEFNPHVSVEENNNNHELAVGKNTFLMLPQTLPEGAEIVVEFIDITNTTRTLHASIANTQWIAGSVITYHISTQSILYTPIISLSENSHTFPFSACVQSTDFTFASYSEVSQAGASSTYRFEPFEYEILDENGQPIIIPEGAEPYISANLLTTFPLEGENEITSNPTSLNRLSVGVLSTNTGLVIDEDDKENTTKKLREASTPEETNLAMTEFGETTANCYMVHAPGTYKFPIVYGNALLKGAPNTKAYEAVSGTNFTKYYNYKGQEISSPHIKNDQSVSTAGINIGTAELIWQDVNGLIQSLDNNDDYITFTISRDKIREGNAIIALKDNDDVIVWSWHIWVTTYNELEDVVVTNVDDVDIKLMSKYIGYCHPYNKRYPDKKAIIRIKQVNTNKIEDISITLSGETLTDVGNSVYYQYGRKDPFPGLLLDWTDVSGFSRRRYTFKPIYDYNGQIINQPMITSANSRYTISEAIQHPNIQSVGSTNSTVWYTGTKTFQNLWSNRTTIVNTSNVVKTIYDPSPAGYSMPPPTVASVIVKGTASLNEEDDNFSLTVTLGNGKKLHMPWMLDRGNKGYYNFTSTDRYTIDKMAIWESTFYSKPVFKPYLLIDGSSSMQSFDEYKCVALPIMPMRQN